VDDFRSARLLLGRGDVQALRAPDNPEAKALAKALAYWLNGPGKLDEVIGDRDVFGDGLVVMLDLPGHTPGHHGLLLKLSKFGYVVLSADVAHFRENYESDGLPRWNTDRAQSLASLQRVKQIVRNLQATLVIQHEVEDIEKLPKFPDAAE
jgi:glyoxylase-like metal-dependent hydrolase (beta-lactamase superfamily II)